jgi:hypothetical protein
MYYNPSYMNPIAQQPMQQEFSQQPTQEPLEGIASLAPTQPSQPIPPQMTPPPGGIANLPSNNGFETSFNLLQRPDQNIERQYFYNKDINKLFNMPGGVRMAAPKGFESVTKDQYQDFANKGATLQGASMFNDAFGGGYNLDLPRDEFGVIDRTSSEYNYFHGDNQQKPNMFMGNATLPNLPPSLLELNPIQGGAVNPMDEYQKGYMNSDFYSPRSTTDVQKFNYKGKDMQGSGTYVSGFENYLNSIGQGDLFKRPPNELMSQELQQGQGIQGLAAYQSQQNTGPGI